jgi:hypothetical protein
MKTRHFAKTWFIKVKPRNKQVPQRMPKNTLEPSSAVKLNLNNLKRE